MLSYASEIERLAADGESSRHAFNEPFSIKKVTASLKSVVKSWMKTVKYPEVKINPVQMIQAKKMITETGILAAERAWREWAFIIITRRIRMTGLENFSEFASLPEDVARGIDQDFVDLVSPRLLTKKAADEFQKSKDVEYIDFNFEKEETRSIKYLDSLLDGIQLYLKRLIAYVPKDDRKIIEDSLFEFMVSYGSDKNVRELQQKRLKAMIREERRAAK